MHKGKEIPYFGLIDSGADINLFHAEIAELLGLKLEAGEKQARLVFLAMARSSAGYPGIYEIRHR